MLGYEQVLLHEYFHVLVRQNPGLLGEVAAKFDEQYTEAERRAIVNDYFDAYGFYDLSEDYVLEEVLADYYGGIDIFSGTEDVQTDFDKRRGTVMLAAREATKYGQERTEADTGGQAFSRDTLRELSEMPEEARSMEVNGARFSRETDRDALNWLNEVLNYGENTSETDTENGYVKVYRTMQLIDGKLYPPMAARKKNQKTGKYEYVAPADLGVWNRADELTAEERKRTLDKNGRFPLDKGIDEDGNKLGTVWAAYNPYNHGTLGMLNDQFSTAYKRPNLVVVEAFMPKSEFNGEYQADDAKDPTGWIDWKAGNVSSQIKKQTGRQRKVALSRWIYLNRILDDAEVARHIADVDLAGTDIRIPANVVTPKLYAALREYAPERVTEPEVGYAEDYAAYQEKSGGKFSREQHEIRYPQYTETEIKNNSVELQRMKPVVEISGTEIDEMEGKLDDRVLRLFAQWENNVFSEQFGDVSIKKSSIRSEHRHGGTDGKVRSYPAIPDVIKNGVVIDSFEKHPGVERIVVAAPIIMGEQKYYMGVMLQRSIDSQRLYAHDVVIEKEPTGIFEDDLSTTGSPKRGELHITNILLNALNVKGKFSRELDAQYMDAVETGDMETAKK